MKQHQNLLSKNMTNKDVMRARIFVKHLNLAKFDSSSHSSS